MAGYIGSKASVVSSGAERKKTFAITTNTTSLTGLSYTVNQVHVFHNGVRLVDGTDYTATNGTSITLTSAAENGDEVVVISYAAFQTSDTVSASAGGTFAGDVSFTGNVSVDGGTIKLDGNYPVGTGNVALGDTALDSNVSGNYNTAVGGQALTSATTTSSNTAVGFYSLNSTTGSSNTAVGDTALGLNTTGSYNSALGNFALRSNTTASYNTAVGYQALYTSSTGQYNTAIGHRSGKLNTTGTGNTFIGTFAGEWNTTGTSNTFLGDSTGYQITTGSKNTILGRYNGNQGGLDIRTSSNNIVLSDGDGNPRVWVSSGGNALFQGDVLPQIDAGFVGHSDLGDPTLRYEDAYVRDGVTTGSDEQDKTEIIASDLGLDFITRLNPVSYKWNDGSRTHYGLIAQQLESVIHEVGKSNSDFAGIIKNSTPVEGRDYTYGIRYQELISPMIKAIQEQQATIEALEARITALEAN